MLRNTFSEKVKKEITTIKYDEKILKNIFYSFILNNGSINLSNGVTTFNITISLNFIARYLKKLMNELYKDLNSNIWYKETHISHGYLIVINNMEILEKKFNIFTNIKNIKLDELEMKGFLIGAFISSGSIYFSSKKSSYHFEIRSSNLDYLNKIKEILDYFNIKSSIINYRNNYKIYFKKSEYLSDILKIFDAEESMFEFEEIRIEKDFSNSLQRLTNLEVSNINKTILASQNHIKWIKYLMDNELLDEFNSKTIKFCNVRLENPHASLSTISEIMLKKYKINIPRTSINHILKRIEKKYNEYNK